MPASAARTPGPPLPAFAARPVAVQRQGAGGAFAVETRALGFASSGGRPLPEALRSKMEAALGADFSTVRVHVGPQAERIGAIAFTLGSDIYFAPGRYQPDTVHGQQLLGHELAHVVQQRAGRVKNPLGSGLAVVQDHALEAEADRLGQRAAAHRLGIQAETGRTAPRSLVKAQPLTEAMGFAQAGVHKSGWRRQEPPMPRHRRQMIDGARGRTAQAMMGDSTKLTGIKRDQVEHALRRARSICRRLSEMDDNSMIELVKKAIGADISERQASIWRQRFLKVYKYLMEINVDSFVFDKNIDDNVFAETYPYDTQEKAIHLGDLFFDCAQRGNDSDAGVLIHEVTHKRGLLSTDDHAYGSEVMHLQYGQQLNNAESFERIAEYYQINVMNSAMRY